MTRGYGDGQYGEGTYGDFSLNPAPDPTIDPEAARLALRQKILEWRAQGKSWAWIQSTGPDTEVWAAYQALGGDKT